MSRRPVPHVALAPEHLPLVLVGLPGAGKTTVARLLATALGLQVTDTDAEIRRRARMTIPEIFAAEGEEGFRTRETRALRAVLDSPAPAQGVVALGGGAILREQNRALLHGHTVVYLAASPETAAAHVGDGTGRPLVAPEADSDATAGALHTAQGAAHTGPRRHDRHGAVLARMEALHVQRAPLYAEVATLTVPADGLTPQQVAALILVGLGAQAPSTARALADLTAPASAAGTRPRRPSETGAGVLVPPSRSLRAGDDGRLHLTVLGARPYEVVVGQDLAVDVVRGVTGAPGGGAGGVALIHIPELETRAGRYEDGLRAAGLRVERITVPGGETSKSSTVLNTLWEQLGRMRMGRDGCVVAVGGGATTDLVGFAAATWLRGVPVVHVPTTLLAMVDAAVGGKSGIDTAAGKNLVGAFHPPAAVVCDLTALEALPLDELRAGLGEVVKCGFIADPVILDRVMTDPAGIVRWDSPALAELVARSVAVKAAVVGKDLTEAGPREILNYGHTYAHAVEAATAYHWRHGEAVAVGCVFAAEVAHRMGRLSGDVLALHRQAFSAAGLPVSFPEGAGRFEELVEDMRSDKKVRAGAIRMVLLDDVARPARGLTPDAAVLREAHKAVTGAGPGTGE